MDALTIRQQRERDYHREHARTVAATALVVDYDVATSPRRRWWNAFWDSWTFLKGLELAGKKVLVVGCGSGLDAILFAKLGAEVCAFDLSPDMLAHARALAARDGHKIAFAEMAAEKLTYDDSSFDLIYCRDILHHVDIPEAMEEIARVAKPGALMVVNEIYSHSITEKVRRSAVVERALYPMMRGFIYKGAKPYITEDERKLSEGDMALVRARLGEVGRRRYFNFLVTRLVPDSSHLLNRLDRALLVLLGPLGHFLAGRVGMIGRLR